MRTGTLVAAGPRHLPAAAVDNDRLDRIAWRTGPRHRRTDRIEGRERLGDRRVLALERGLPTLVQPHGCTTRYFAISLPRPEPALRRPRVAFIGPELVEEA